MSLSYSSFTPSDGIIGIPDLDERLAKIREVVHLLPRSHYSVLKRFAEHLDKWVALYRLIVIVLNNFSFRVVDYEEKNHMTPDNLATVICPNLLRAPGNNFGLIMKNMGPIIVLFKALITHVSLSPSNSFSTVLTLRRSILYSMKVTGKRKMNTRNPSQGHYQRILSHQKLAMMDSYPILASPLLLSPKIAPYQISYFIHLKMPNGVHFYSFAYAWTVLLIIHSYSLSPCHWTL